MPSVRSSEGSRSVCKEDASQSQSVARAKSSMLSHRRRHSGEMVLPIPAPVQSDASLPSPTVTVSRHRVATSAKPSTKQPSPLTTTTTTKTPLLRETVQLASRVAQQQQYLQQDMQATVDVRARIAETSQTLARLHDQKRNLDREMAALEEFGRELQGSFERLRDAMANTMMVVCGYAGVHVVKQEPTPPPLQRYALRYKEKRTPEHATLAPIPPHLVSPISSPLYHQPTKNKLNNGKSQPVEAFVKNEPVKSKAGPGTGKAETAAKTRPDIGPTQPPTLIPRPRRSASMPASGCYKEPSLGKKLRRGDPHTFH